MKHSILFVILHFITVFHMALWAQDSKLKDNPKVDYKGFLNVSEEVQVYRQNRLVSIEQFNEYAKDKNTIILDTRSKAAYDEVHIKGAVHLNFSDFTTEKLAKVIPDKNTRILIYCNNNFESPLAALTNKSAPLALNIPTFINLYGYGYKNIYELNDYLDQNDPKVDLEVGKLFKN